MDFDDDLFVIGAGSGGIRLSWMAAASGARVAVAEQSRVGGTCVIRGCVPKKLPVYASRYGENRVDAAGYGWEVETGGFSWETLIGRKNREIDRLNAACITTRQNAGVTLCSRRAVMAEGFCPSDGVRCLDPVRISGPCGAATGAACRPYLA
jgi:glutathione reductase (NADPH)